MSRVCNIDAKGRVVRLMTGVMAVTGGLVMALLITQNVLSAEVYWIPAIGSIAGGMFAIWEARAGWCVVRAMGIRTPI
ncbi:MAG: hypothetical protein NLN66_04845 [Candidatus Thalassarchaeaceae archaeon]|nr:hypothetical protein [Candidatus Thalassarchaeaceae archaeon]